MRRASRTPEPTTLTIGDLTLDLLTRKVTRDGTPIELRPREFALLEYLMRNPGKVVSKTMILSSDKYPRPLFLTLWYSSLFVAGSLLIVLLTYVLTAASLAQRDDQIIRAKVGDYANVYTRGGLRALASTVQAEQRTAPERLFVRVVDRGREAIVLSEREGWDTAMLETASLTLRDGTLVQVGKSSEARRELLARFRAALGLVALSVIVIALTGGWIATQSALRPIRDLTAAVRQVIATGQTSQRVPVGPHNDAIDELTRLFNQMLEKIEALVTGMRSALDNVSHDLRTPLTRLRGEAEMALAGAPSPERYREAPRPGQAPSRLIRTGRQNLLCKRRPDP